ncbi:ABC transporter ATP-binding protein [Pararhodospirillum oryzae]|uniref:Nitrate/sulfonate/bicarbonate ABC transporter ATP-binding protein n=1 Tax=Pararhodospirillum oryzae TaxID=478448 RepID=A0A512HA23_9PROT|nr:ATP-binding cassette domain-containing protein [Pararhodospirillum oryzae]GEO82314.1 nitrate/sulfonate/bicarbonate ABC transporter ATP-binding protein [Pararhodospirillum oryzae]
MSAPDPEVPPGLAWVGVSVRAGGRLIVDDLTLAVPAGAVLALVGPSGCGKTTLLSLAAGLLAPTRGRVERRCARVACLFQDPRLLPWRRARDNAAFGLRCLNVPRAQRRARAQALLETLGLRPEDGDKFPAQLSGGMRQRVALARALAIEPDLLLLDEPFNALDPARRRDLQDLVRREVTARQVTAVFVTHDLGEALRVSDHVAVMAGTPGRLVHLAPGLGRAPDRGPTVAEDSLAPALLALGAHPAVRAVFGPVGGAPLVSCPSIRS